MAFVIIILLFAALLIIPRLAGASVGAVISAIFNKAGSSRADYQRLHASFTTSLTAPDVLAATSDAAAMLPGARADLDHAVGTANVTFRSGGSALVGVTPGREGENRVRVTPAGQRSDDMLARFRSSMLAALRARDPGTRHG
jgi:hypothetical protein